MPYVYIVLLLFLTLFFQFLNQMDNRTAAVPDLVLGSVKEKA